MIANKRGVLRSGWVGGGFGSVNKKQDALLLCILSCHYLYTLATYGLVAALRTEPYPSLNDMISPTL